jgi:hypothetical protein
MSDPLRHDRPPAAGDVPERDRDARVEELLLIGLDHYFAGQPELAISVWTRVLFLDRGHARARAYIERARGAIAERQREGEELLHGGVAAFNRGDGGAARRLLTSAVERGAASEEAIALLERLDRLEAATSPADRAIVRRSVVSASEREEHADNARPRQSRLAWIATGLVSGIAVAVTAAFLWNGAHDWWPAGEAPPPASATRPRLEPLIVPSAAEISIGRAERLHRSGRLHDALDALGEVRQGDALRPRADSLRATIQRQLLDAAHAAQPRSSDRSPGAPRQ